MLDRFLLSPRSRRKPGPTLQPSGGLTSGSRPLPGLRVTCSPRDFGRQALTEHNENTSLTAACKNPLLGSKWRFPNSLLNRENFPVLREFRLWPATRAHPMADDVAGFCV